MIDVHQDGARWTVMLNRPDKANALSVEMLEALDDIFTRAHAARGLRVLVVTGAGQRVFCAGADLGEARSATSITTNPIWESVSNRLAKLPCLTIAALNGTLAGGGFGVALACDMRVAVPNAKFFYPVLKNGFLPQPSDVKRLNALVGPARAKLILLAGQKLSADDALSFGLIDRIANDTDLDITVDELSAAALAAAEPVLVAIKRLNQNAGGKTGVADCFKAVYEHDEPALERLRSA